MYRIPSCCLYTRACITTYCNILYLGLIYISYIGLRFYIDGLMQDCGISSAVALEIPQSCINSSIQSHPTRIRHPDQLGIKINITEKREAARLTLTCLVKTLSMQCISPEGLSSKPWDRVQNTQIFNPLRSELF